ncbi:hypothetical protein FOMG_02604 [Fusarium oxysporum f. sp. melonis 26406]|uniref:Uncharacterized protein n=1 Tax=Fusarium oxysporum f. sp. melonis 26406 TaxID=1089452 RepID=X0BEZ9_FUSOX|nr:hypothetical protein FOMG_02604 [Fusarium oxysporum f. sp. melonis 26406]
MIAPPVPEYADGCDYSVSVLAGPGTLQKTLNSIIQANKDSIMSSVQEQLRGSDHRIKGITADYLGCSFAAVSKQGRNSPWNMDLIFNFSGTVGIRPFWWSPTFDNYVPDLTAQLSFTIDATNSSKDVKQVPQIHVHRIQLSCGKIRGLLKTITISLTSELDIPARNNTKNSALLEGINVKLSDSLSKLGDLAKLEPMEQYNLSNIPQTLPSRSNHHEWMSSLEIQWKQLGQLKIPRTHNSAAYKFDRIISPMLEKGVDKLVNLRTVGQAPSDHRLDDTNNIFIGQQAYDDLIYHITLLSQPHDESKTLKTQLEDGIRFHYLRIYRDDKDGDYYNQHFLRGPKLDELLNQIRQYLEEQNSSGDFIIVELAQCNYGEEHGI